MKIDKSFIINTIYTLYIDNIVNEFNSNCKFNNNPLYNDIFKNASDIIIKEMIERRSINGFCDFAITICIEKTLEEYYHEKDRKGIDIDVDLNIINIEAKETISNRVDSIIKEVKRRVF